MKRNSGRTAILPILVMLLGVVMYARAQQTPPAYDLSKEITVQGTIEKIDASGGNGPMGTHILLQTETGTVDVHLGAGPGFSAAALGLSTGESVSVTGLMDTVNNQSVLLGRILKTPSRTFLLRNANGIPLRTAVPQNSSTASSAAKGGF